MKNLVLAVAAMFFAAFGWSAGAVASADKLYSIQVRAVPLTEKADGMATYRALRDKGYLTYIYPAEIDGKPWLRVAVGVFDSDEDAAAFGKFFSTNVGLDHFVARAPVRVTAADGGNFVVTPNALWTRQGERVREVFVFDDPPPEGFEAPGRIKLKPSPDGKAVAFQYGDRVYAVGLDNDKAKRVAGGAIFGLEHIYGPTPYWSPSGRYIAFHDFLEFEVKTSLWVALADGGALRALVDNRPAESQTALKAFVWHPTEDRILFIEAYAWGTMAEGGDIQSIDMEGTVTTVIAADNQARQQFIGPLRIEDGYLHYRKLEFDAGYDKRTVSNARIPIADL
ncbi:MAG: SPOR domain-containing protein [Proteobacteria bacterium]|nr:SPOR domain-containing protein [Pseudomonadota bacterium]